MPNRTAFIYYDTPEECARAAASVFQENNWRWKVSPVKTLRVPTYEEILQKLLYLQENVNPGGRIETGRLVYIDGKGKFGHEIVEKNLPTQE